MCEVSCEGLCVCVCMCAHYIRLFQLYFILISVFPCSTVSLGDPSRCCSCGVFFLQFVAMATSASGGRSDALGLVLILVTQLAGLPERLDLRRLNPSLPVTKLSVGSPAAPLMER